MHTALARLFPAAGAAAQTSPRDASPQAPQPQQAADVGGSGTLAAQAQRLYQRALQAQRDGNWSQYGEDIRQLGELLQRMNASPGK